MIAPATFAYPAEGFHSLANSVPAFSQAIQGMTVNQLQELYTQTFDWNPETSLELGWHLYGENYDRGEFLVKVRELLRRYGIPETQGLPDHVAHIVPLLAHVPADFRTEYVLPALKKIENALERTGNPYRLLFCALREEVEHE